MVSPAAVCAGMGSAAAVCAAMGSAAAVCAAAVCAAMGSAAAVCAGTRLEMRLRIGDLFARSASKDRGFTRTILEPVREEPTFSYVRRRET